MSVVVVFTAMEIDYYSTITMYNIVKAFCFKTIYYCFVKVCIGLDF